jgi:hypothetical protein
MFQIYSHATPDEKMKRVIFFVEANSLEQQMLWEKNKDNVLWENDGEGFGKIIGHINKQKTKPVNLHFSFANINGQYICFYDAISRFVDHTMIEDYIRKHWPIKWDSGTRSAMTDASNFHHALDAIKEANDAIKEANKVAYEKAKATLI